MTSETTTDPAVEAAREIESECIEAWYEYEGFDHERAVAIIRRAMSERERALVEACRPFVRHARGEGTLTEGDILRLVEARKSYE